MKTVHIILQGKGGVGKSFIASALAQFLVATEKNVHLYDTDPVNQTFGHYKKLNVQMIDILTSHKQIDASKFDGLIEEIATKEGIAVIDNGAATFVPLMSYLRESNIIDYFNENGIAVIAHVPIVGGQATMDTLQGLGEILHDLNVPVIVWQNKYWGDIVIEGKALEDLSIYKNNMDKIINVINLKSYNPDTFGKDIREMTSNHLTFDEFIHSKKYTLMPKQRIKTVWNDIFTSLEQIPLLLTTQEN